MQLKLISSNIRYENVHDGIHSWENRRPILQKIITDFHPDILATQEGREKQIKSLCQLLPLKLVESHRQWIEDRMYPCLYINEEQIKVKSSGDIWLSETPLTPGSFSFKSTFPRLCIWMQVTHLVNNQDYFVVNTHLDHVLEETRLEQIKVLIREVENLNKENLPIILMGDFNDSPLSKVREFILNSLDLKDPWLEVGFPEETSHHGFKEDKDKQVIGDRIDWILVPQAFAVEEIYLEKKSFNGIFPSDHYPLLATVIPR
ncbi:MAG: endonuclease/exonuclease/phosphatase family protein [Bacteriovorax sp.]|nr:endonuclease/exonuclease/phosphatase family protein [Bacteriovorax sp.]